MPVSHFGCLILNTGSADRVAYGTAEDSEGRKETNLLQHTGNSSRHTGIAPLPLAGQEESVMLWTLFAVLLILWLLGWGFHVAGALIHALLVIAVLILIVNLVTGHAGP